MKRAFSGAQPTGLIHIGNYFGAIKQWVDTQDEYDGIFSIVDLHALTVSPDPKELERNTLDLAKMYLACGLDPKKSVIFVQSHVPEHAELAWILNTNTHLGELNRMTQFKEKGEGKETSNLGLLAYPVLMAADILLYQTDVVPVGDDQKQHVELTRDIAERFNNKYGKTFTVPDIKIMEGAARLMGLDDPSKKMSKSATSEKNYIALLDSPEVIRDKIKVAVTDSDTVVKFDPENKPAISNLILIYSLATGKTQAEVESEFSGKTYGDFKKELAEALITALAPIQEKFHAITDSEAQKILTKGAEKAKAIASETLNEVKKHVGLLGS